MSFTAAYTQLNAIRDGEVHQASRTRGHPRILDPDGFETAHQGLDIGESTFRDITIKGEEKDHSKYPTQTWQTVKGFKTWKPASAFGLDYEPDRNELVKKIRGHEDYRTGPLGYGYNLERLGVTYGGWNGVWRSFFEEVSKYTEPFAFYHSLQEHEFPDVTEFQGGKEQVVYVECHDGEMYAETQTFQRTHIDPAIEDTEKVGNHDLGTGVTDGQ